MDLREEYCCITVQISDDAGLSRIDGIRVRQRKTQVGEIARRNWNPTALFLAFDFAQVLWLISGMYSLNHSNSAHTATDP